MDRDEIDANAFAAGVLMPEDEVWQVLAEQHIDLNDEVSLRKAARHFGVSLQALTFRIANLRASIDGVARF